MTTLRVSAPMYHALRWYGGPVAARVGSAPTEATTWALVRRGLLEAETLTLTPMGRAMLEKLSTAAATNPSAHEEPLG